MNDTPQFVEQVRTMIAKVEEWEGMASVLPTVIGRLNSLKGLHQEAATFRCVGASDFSFSHSPRNSPSWAKKVQRGTSRVKLPSRPSLLTFAPILSLILTSFFSLLPIRSTRLGKVEDEQREVSKRLADALAVGRQVSSPPLITSTPCHLNLCLHILSFCRSREASPKVSRTSKISLASLMDKLSLALQLLPLSLPDHISPLDGVQSHPYWLRGLPL